MHNGVKVTVLETFSNEGDAHWQSSVAQPVKDREIQNAMISLVSKMTLATFQ